MERFLINGIPSEYVSASDRGLHYADGIFETIACIGSVPIFIEQHLNRMQTGARTLDIPFPDTRLILDDIDCLLRDQAGNSVIKLVLTRGRGRRGYRYDSGLIPTRLCVRSDWPQYAAHWQQRGIRAQFCETPLSSHPVLHGIKTLGRLENVLAGSELDADIDEGFMSDVDGHVVEGTMSNIFAVIDDVLTTPDLSHCGIKGIMREQVIEAAYDGGIDVDIRDLSREQLLQSNEIFICNSVIRICPVRQLAQQHYTNEAMTKTIDSLLQRRIDANAKAAA